MTVPLILTVFPTFAVGGAQMRFTTLANHFGARFRHAIVALDGNQDARERLAPGLDVMFPEIETRKGGTLGNVRRYHAALRTLRPHTMLTNNFGSIEWAMANRLGTVRHVHVEDGFGPEERNRQIKRRVLLRRAFLRGRTVALPSQTLMRIATGTWRLNPANLRYLPNGIDLARFGGQPPAANGPPVIGTVAALRAEKNLARLLRAFRLATTQTPARLLIIGDGPERADLQALAQELGIADAVEWSGHVADPAPLIKRLDIFAMSSDTEQMPMSLLEAMAAGLPVAATNVGDIAAMLPQSAQPYITPLSPEPLGAALRSLLESSSLRRQLGADNRAKAERDFDQTAMFCSWAELLEGSRQSDGY